MPRNVELKFGIMTARALIGGLADDARIRTVNGDAVIGNHYGDLKSVRGEMTMRDHHGKIVARNVSGDLMATGEIMSSTMVGVSGTVFLGIRASPTSRGSIP